MTIQSYKPHTTDEVTVFELYYRLLQAWNEKDARSFAWLFSGTALVIGFDGNLMSGQEQVEKELKAIFNDHPTGSYVSKIRDVKHLDHHCLLLSAIAGMVPAGDSKINPSLNTVQTLLAVKKDSVWHIELFQNTPAQFHNHREFSESLTRELNSLALATAAI